MSLGKPTPRDAIAGLVTGLFSIPEGMAYASIGGFLPVQGLYSGMVPTIVGSLFARTALMITTLTSAIALTSNSVLGQAGLDATAGNVAMLAVMVGVVMILFGVLKLGNLMAFVSNAVMTGFTTGIALQIVVGVFKDMTGYSSDRSNTLAKAIDVVAHVGQWNLAAIAVSLGTVAIWLLAYLIKPLRSYGTLIALGVASVVVAVAHISVDTVGDIAQVPQSLPDAVMPQWSAAPSLALGAVAVALVALAQGAGIGAAVPNRDGSRTDVNADFVAQGAANVAGGFFGALPTGGSLSRTGVAVEAGARTRWTGIFSGIWLVIIVLVAGRYAQYIPMPVIGGLVLVIGIELIVGRWRDISMILRSAPLSAVAMVLTFLATTQLPLQQAILLGAVISLVLSSAGMVHGARLRALQKRDGAWVVEAVPAKAKSHEVLALYYGGAALFAQLVRMGEQWPDFTGVRRAALIVDLGRFGDVPSTSAVRTLIKRAEALRDQDCRLLIAGLDERGYHFLERSRAIEAIGAENVFVDDELILGSLARAYAEATRWVAAVGTDDDASKDSHEGGVE